MPQPEYIVKESSWGTRKRFFGQKDLQSVRYPEVTRVKSINQVGGFAFRQMEGTGKFQHDRVTLNLKECSTCYTVRLTREGLNERIRRLRPQEREELDRIDAEIQALRTLRRETVARAWTNAHKVTVAEIKEQAR